LKNIKNMDVGKRRSAYAYLSQLILKVMADQSLEEETIYSFSLYLQLGVVRSASVDFFEARELTASVLKIVSEGLKDKLDLGKFEKLLSGNGVLVGEIIRDIWCPGPDLQWINNWIAFSASFLAGERADRTALCLELFKIIDDSLELRGRQSNIFKIKLIDHVLRLSGNGVESIQYGIE
jgi:hypothetical protein